MSGPADAFVQGIFNTLQGEAQGNSYFQQLLDGMCHDPASAWIRVEPPHGGERRDHHGRPQRYRLPALTDFALPAREREGAVMQRSSSTFREHRSHV
jgi:hypothetical protein